MIAAEVSFGQRLRELRKARGFTQLELAQKAGVSFTYVSKLETGAASPPRQNNIINLSKALNLNEANIDELFGLAKKIPSELLSDIDVHTIDMLRSLKHGEKSAAEELAILQRRIDDIEASQNRTANLHELADKHNDIFRVLVETSPDGIVILGSKLEVIYKNGSISRIFNYEPEEFGDKETFGIIHPNDMPRIASRLTRMIHNPDDIRSHAQCRVKHNDGSWRVVDAVANNLLNNPIVRGIVVVIHEIRSHTQNIDIQNEHEDASAIVKKYRLTETEHKVLTLIADGKTNPQIAEKLIVSTCTVRFHVTGILRKLGVSSRTGAVAVAVRHHLVD